MFGGQLPAVAPRAAPRDTVTRLGGGLDKETPSWNVPPGALRDALNYEVHVEGGYQDVTGYERFDGRTKPSEADFSILDVTITGSIEVGDTVTGVTTGATGYVLAVATYPDDATQSYLVLTQVTGSFNNATENLTVSAVVEGNVDAIAYANAGPTSKLTAQYNNLAADQYRTLIAVVPGEGDVWGGFAVGGNQYAIRNKVGSVTAGLYVESATGWTEVTLNDELAFTSGGTYQIQEGDTITGATSGATATVERVQVTGGTWAGGDAVGWLILSSVVGTFQAEDLDVGANLNVATIAGDSAAATLQPSGRLDYDCSNFADPAGAERVYGADGVNTAWEFDGTVFAKIRTGMTTDTPSHVRVHKRQLFLSFVASVQHSSPGDPFNWSVITGAAELATGFTITGFHVEPGSEGNATLLVACRQHMFMLYGNDVGDWNLVEYREKVGAYEWTIQQVAYTLFLDDTGIVDLRTVQAFGNFDHSQLSTMIRRLIATKRPLAVASVVVRDKNQYRLFFSDKTAIYVTMQGQRVMGMMPIQLGHQITCTWQQEDANGNEEVFFGADDGYVYQMEKGTSFDGDNIFAYIYTHYDNLESIEWVKEFFAPVTIEGTGTGYAEVDVSYELDYGSSDVGQPDVQVAELPLGTGSTWDSGLLWDTAVVWDDTSQIPTLGLDLRGEGRNISWILTKDSDYFAPVLLTGLKFQYSRKHRARG